MSESESETSQTFGKYELIDRIAVGGMAEIFRAKKKGAEGFEKEVVLKRVLPHYSEDEAFITMFKDEAKIAANLNHANICQVFEFDELDGSFYIAMEYIPGRDLKQVAEEGIKRGMPMSVAQVAWVSAQVSDGLHYAHIKEYNGQPLNIVHRDVTPHNVMVSMGGEVKLMDFGIAKAAARSTKTQAGTVKGKCAYMSPEQARGKDLDGRSDVYAIGIWMWELLTGERLFLGETEFETLSNVLKKEIPLPSTRKSGIPPRMDEIVMKALARNRDSRYEDASALKRDLMTFFYSQCDPNKLLLDKYMAYLFADGPMPDLGGERAQPPPTLDTLATFNEDDEEDGATRVMPSVEDELGVAPPPLAGGAPPPPPPPPAPDGGADPLGQAASGAGAKEKKSGQTARLMPIEASPVMTAYTGQNGKSSSNKLFIGIGVVVCMVVGALAVSMTGGGDEGKSASKKTASADGAAGSSGKQAPKTMTTVRIKTKPKGALVYVGDEPSSKSPFEFKGSPGTKLKLKIRKSGYKTVRKTIMVEEKSTPQVISIKLKKKKKK